MSNSYDITKIDPNMNTQTTLKHSSIRFYNVKEEPFELYGFYNPKTEPQFKRLPDEIGLNVNPGVSKLYLETSELFAWTVVVILLSLAIEKLTGYLILRLQKRRGHAED